MVLTATLAAITVATLPDGRLHLTVMDVGQGDGILVVTPAGRSMLVDAGPDPDQTLRQLGAKMPWWRLWLFLLMARNAVSATEFFHIPSDRVVELGVRVAI